jgi:hypothetical protein
MKKRIIDAFIDFANEHPDDEWVQLIQEPPYNIEVRQKGSYYLFKYNQLESDMSLPLCQACRGIIVQKGLSGQWSIVCYPFDKFFNYGEPNAADIDWYSAFVNEKIDGSLIKFWYNYDGWHLSTNNSIDAFDAPVSNSIEELTFGNLVERALGCNWLSFCRELDEHYTYMFELVSPESQVTIHYDHTTLYYLGQRDNIFYKESYDFRPIWREFGICEPKVFNLTSLDGCIAAVGEMSKDEEGVVVSDVNFNRIKVKSPEYLIAAHCANNGKLGLRTAIRLIREDKVDDFLAYAPMHRAKLEFIKMLYFDLVHDWEWDYGYVKEECWRSKREFVKILHERKIEGKAFCYAIWRYENRDKKPFDYLNTLSEKCVIKMVKDLAKAVRRDLDE